MTSSEISTHMTENDARLVTGYIRNLIASVTEKIDEIGRMLTKAYDRRAWLALGYESWDAYVSAELRTDRMRLDRGDRQELVVQLRSAGMSTRAIGAAVGTSDHTVREDLKSTARNHAVQEPESVRSLDGRERPATQTPRARDLPQADPPAVEDSAVPAPSVTPSEAVTEYLNGSQSVQDAKYLHAFAKAIARADDFLRFDADRVGRLCDNDDVVSVQHLLDFTEEFLSRMRKARTGLRVVNGGKS